MQVRSDLIALGPGKLDRASALLAASLRSANQKTTPDQCRQGTAHSQAREPVTHLLVKTLNQIPVGVKAEFFANFNSCAPWVFRSEDRGARQNSSKSAISWESNLKTAVGTTDYGLPTESRRYSRLENLRYDPGKPETFEIRTSVRFSTPHQISPHQISLARAEMAARVCSAFSPPVRWFFCSNEK